MKIVLLKKNAPVSSSGFEGHLTEMSFHGRSALGVVTPASVFRPITESVKVSGARPGRPPHPYSILPEFRDFVEELLEGGVVGRHIPQGPRHPGSRTSR